MHREGGLTVGITRARSDSGARRVHAGVSPRPRVPSLTWLCTPVLFGNTALKKRRAPLVIPAECLPLALP